MVDSAGKPQTRVRSPSFPYIGLSKAVERARMLFKSAKRFEVRVEDAAVDWGLGPKSSSTLQTVATLLAYGLIESRTTPEGRKIKVSDSAWRILEDQRSGVKEQLLAEAAMKPDQFQIYAAKWRLSDGDRPDDTHATSQLKFDDGYTEEAARRFLRVFDEAISFAREGGVLGSGVAEKEGDKGAEISETPEPNANLKEDEHMQAAQQMRGRTPPPPPPAHRAPFRVSFEGGALEVTGRLTTPKDVDNLVKFLQLNKIMIATIDEPMATDYTDDEEGRAAEERDKRHEAGGGE